MIAKNTDIKEQRVSSMNQKRINNRSTMIQKVWFLCTDLQRCHPLFLWRKVQTDCKSRESNSQTGHALGLAPAWRRSSTTSGCTCLVAKRKRGFYVLLQNERGGLKEKGKWIKILTAKGSAGQPCLRRSLTPSVFPFFAAITKLFFFCKF